MQRSGGGGDEARGEDPRGPGHPREGGQPAEAGVCHHELPSTPSLCLLVL